MLTRIFGQITSATSIFIAIYAVVLGGVHFYFQEPPSNTLQTEYGTLVFHPLAADIVYAVLTLILVYGFQFLIFTKHKLVKHNAYIPYVLLPLVLIWLPTGGLTMLVEAVIFLLILQQWLAAYQGDKMLSSSLNTGFLLGVGALVNTEFWLLLLLGFVVYTIYGRFSFRTFLIPIIGYLTVWVNLLAVEFLVSDSTFLYDGFLQHFAVVQGGSLVINSYLLALLGAVLLPGLYEFTLTVSHASVFKKQSYIIMLLVLVISTAAFFLYGLHPFNLAIGIPIIAVLFANFLQYVQRKWVTEIVLWLILVVFGIFESGWL